MTENQPQVAALVRGLEAIAALNDHGPLGLGDLSRHLNLPRTTTRRIMTTLIAENCCIRATGGRLYGLAPGVERLSRGLTIADRLTAPAAEILPPLGSATGWPVGLAVPEDLVMRVRVSTDFTSRYALARVRPGYATPMVGTTTGLIYLASLDETDAADRLDRTYAMTWRAPLRFRRDEVEALMAAARTQDHLILERQFPEGSLGVPLTVEGKVCGGLVMRYVRSAVRKEEVRAVLLPRLQQAADHILEAAKAVRAGAGR